MDTKEALALRRKILGLLLRKARLKAGRSAKECARVLGCSSRALYQIERGRKDISLPQLETLARFLEVPLDYFWQEEPVPEERPQQPDPGLLALRRKALGVLLREARLAARMTQEECAQILGCNVRRISEYERGERDIPVPELEMLAQAFHVPMSYFLDESIFPPSEKDIERRELEQLRQLPADVKQFVLKPSNVLYLRAAMRISELSADALRQLAESLLEITY